MRRSFVPLPRIAALSVVITLFAAPLASAQSPEAAQPSAAPANTALLSPAAFARLVQPPPAAVARQAQSAPAKAPQQNSWVARHKVATALIICAAVGVTMWGIVGGFRGQSFD